jgi:ketosteroid isomerase-like protein
VEIRPAKIRIVQPDVTVVRAAWQMRGDARRSEPLLARWTGSDRADVKDRVEAAIAAFDEAWNRRDKTALTRRFAPEAGFVDTAARWLQRRELIANHDGPEPWCERLRACSTVRSVHSTTSAQQWKRRVAACGDAFITTARRLDFTVDSQSVSRGLRPLPQGGRSFPR